MRTSSLSEFRIELSASPAQAGGTRNEILGQDNGSVSKAQKKKYLHNFLQQFSVISMSAFQVIFFAQFFFRSSAIKRVITRLLKNARGVRTAKGALLPIGFFVFFLSFFFVLICSQHYSNCCCCSCFANGSFALVFIWFSHLLWSELLARSLNYSSGRKKEVQKSGALFTCCDILKWCIKMNNGVVGGGGWEGGW